MRKLAKQLQIDIRNFSEMEKNERRFDVTLGYSTTVRDVFIANNLKPNFIYFYYQCIVEERNVKTVLDQWKSLKV